jgi:hypothetical protein
MATQQNTAPVENAAEKKTLSPFELDREIGKKFKFFIGTAMNLDKTIWPGAVRDALQAVVDLVSLSKKAGIKPAELRRMKIYMIATDRLRSLFEETIMLRLGEEFDFAFALERGFEDLLQRECNIIHERGEARCKIRFVKAKIETGDYAVYERVCIRFDGQYDIQFIDRSRYGL